MDKYTCEAVKSISGAVFFISIAICITLCSMGPSDINKDSCTCEAMAEDDE